MKAHNLGCGLNKARRTAVEMQGRSRDARPCVSTAVRFYGRAFLRPCVSTAVRFY
ncbi:MAG: hypothetical protein VSS75_003355 [Candidatus Parabeggiatoa sp.]|nr:hypothetical protein [Candidatus Parabeggiatoa sp.]